MSMCEDGRLAILTTQGCVYERIGEAGGMVPLEIHLGFFFLLYVFIQPLLLSTSS